MLKAFLGTDTHRARTALSAAIEAFRAQHPDSPVLRFDADHCPPGEVLSALQAESLFGGPSLIVLDGLAETAETETVLLDALPHAEKSTQTVLLIDTTLKKDLRTALEKVIPDNALCEWKKPEKRDSGDNFLLGDMFASRDKKGFWQTLTRLIHEDNAPEELHGILWWAAKSLYIAKESTSQEAEKAGLKGFSYSKFKRFSEKWTKEEIEAALDRLKDIIHERQEGKGADLEILLEEFALTS